MGQVVLSKTDAWVFMAIGKPMFGWDRLSDVVFSLDYLNRAMPSEAEFEASVRNLGAAGLIRVSSNGFRQTRSGNARLKRFGLLTGVIAVMLELMSAWDGLAVPVTDETLQFHLKPGEWQRAQAAFEVRRAELTGEVKK